MLGCLARRSIRRRALASPLELELQLDSARDLLVHKIFRTSKGILPYSHRCHSTSTSTSSSTIQEQEQEPEPVSNPNAPSNNDYGLYRLLKVNEREWLREQRQLTTTTQRLARQVGGVSLPHSTFLQELQLDSTFSVVVAGEFNAGKSTLINALLGKKLLESGALPTTDSITIVASPSSSSSSKDKDSSSALPLGVVVHTVPNIELLQDLTLVDTPGTNSTWLDHTEQTLRLLPAADLILFCTSADRPFPESERQLLQQIQTYRKSIVLIVNKMDILDAAGGDHGQDPKNQVVEFVTDQAATILGARPMVIPVSSRDALTAKLSKKSSQLTNVWERSNFAALEHYLQSSLTTQAKLKSKLSSPIGVAEGVMLQCLQVLGQQGQELEADIATLNIFQSQFVGWKKEMSADLMISRNEMSDRIRAQGERCDVLLNRVSYFELYKSILDRKQLEQEWDETSCSLHSGGLESDLLEQVQETA
jgi:small GTP-binding protein